MKKIFAKAGEGHEKGLSLVEVLVTIAVLSIVAAISLPIITTSIQRTQIDAHKAEMVLTADTIKTSLGAMQGVAVNNFNLGGGTASSYVRINANQDVKFRFDRQNENAFYTVSPSRVTRIVADGTGTTADPYTGFCITAWVGDVNLELNSNDPTVEEYGRDATYANGIGPCGLKPGPISVPSAPTLTDTPVAVLTDRIATIAYLNPTGDDVGGEDWTNLQIVEGRVTCTSSDGGATVVTQGSSPIQVNQLTEKTNYSCTVAVRNDGFLANDANAWSEESTSTALFYMPNPPKAVASAQVGSPGPEVGVTWVLETDMHGYDFSSGIYGSRMAINNFEIFHLIGCNGGNALNLDTTVLPDPSSHPNLSQPILAGANDLSIQISGLAPGSEYYIWVRALNGAGPDLSNPTSGTNGVGHGDIAYAGCAKTGTDPSVMSSGTFAENNALEGTDNLNGQVAFDWVIASVSGAGTASNWFNGGLPIHSYEWEIDLTDEFDDPEKATGTKLHSGLQTASQRLESSENLPVSTTYFMRMRACNLLNGSNQPAVCAVKEDGTPDWTVPAISGATSSTAPPPESVEATVDNNGVAVVTWN